MSAKDLNKDIETTVKEYKDSILTFEKLIKIFPKAPSAAHIKKILAFTQLYNVTLISSQEQAKRMNAEEAKKKEEETDPKKAEEKATEEAGDAPVVVEEVKESTKETDTKISYIFSHLFSPS